MQASPWAHACVKTKNGGREGRETQGLDFLHFSSRKKKGEEIVLCSKGSLQEALSKAASNPTRS